MSWRIFILTNLAFVRITKNDRISFPMISFIYFLNYILKIIVTIPWFQSLIDFHPSVIEYYFEETKSGFSALLAGHLFLYNSYVNTLMVKYFCTNWASYHRILFVWFIATRTNLIWWNFWIDRLLSPALVNYSKTIIFGRITHKAFKYTMDLHTNCVIIVLIRV